MPLKIEWYTEGEEARAIDLDASLVRLREELARVAGGEDVTARLRLSALFIGGPHTVPTVDAHDALTEAYHSLRWVVYAAEREGLPEEIEERG